MSASRTTTSRRPPVRAALGNAEIVRTSLAYAASALVEWALWVAVVVYAYELGGARAAGLATIALVVPTAAVAAWGSAAADGPRPAQVLLWTYVVQACSLASAAVLAAVDAHPVVVTAPVALAVALAALLRPCYAVVIPGVVRNVGELTASNLFIAWGDNLCVLAGPILAAVLLAIAGPWLMFVIATALTMVGVVASVPLARTEAARPLPPPAARLAPMQALVGALRELGNRRGTRAVLVALTAQFVLIGALDFLYVIIADEALGLGTSGAGWLAALFGVGAVAGGLLSVRLIGRPRLASLTLIPLLVFAIALAALASWTLLAVAVVALPVLGLGRSLIDLSGRMLLQRSAPAGALASIFAVIEILSGLGLIIGSLLAQVLVAVDGTGTALLVLAIAFSLVAAALWRPLRHVDDSADVPVVAIRLLHGIPLFTPLSPPSLEGVARSAIEHEVAAGIALIREGDLGDTYFAIVDGAAEVQVAGRTIRRLQRGDGFGEVALLADVPRTATVISIEPTTLLSIDRVPFLIAVTGSDTSERVAWSMIEGLELGTYRARIAERRSNERPEPPATPPPM